MACVESSELAAALERSCRNDQIVIADHVSGNSQACPDAGMLECRFLGVGNNRQDGEKFAEIPLARRFMRARGAFDAMPEFSDRYSGDFERLIRFRGKPCSKWKFPLFTPNDYVGVENYCHLSAGAFKDLRALRRKSDETFEIAAITIAELWHGVER